MPFGERDAANGTVFSGTHRGRYGRVYALRSLASLLLAVLMALFFSVVTHAEKGNLRVLKQDVVLQVTHWQLLKWQNSLLVCDVFAQGEKPPSALDIIPSCGVGIFQTWVTTPACLQALDGYGAACQGLFLRNLGKTSITVQKDVQLPGMSFEVLATNCSSDSWCDTAPRMKISALEPVAGQTITKLNVVVDGVGNIFDGAEADFGLPQTSESGSWLEYWANSSLGDQSDHIRLKYRNFQPDASTQSYRFDVLGADWSATPASASLVWNIFPPVTHSLPSALQQPKNLDELHTSTKYAYLAGHLIQTGAASAKTCTDQGLLITGVASNCGVEATYPKQLEWQNKYDEKILAAALKYNVPARVIKGIIAQETQFWPTSDNPYELGLGRITDNGADMLLTWNINYYLATCIPTYGQSLCSAGYSSFDPGQRAILRWTILSKTEAGAQIDVLAATLYASAAQTNRMLVNSLPNEPDNAVSYEDMWRITIGNYHSGSGCVSVGMQGVASKGLPLSFDNLVGEMLGGCKDAKNYVDKVLGLFE